MHHVVHSGARGRARSKATPDRRSMSAPRGALKGPTGQESSHISIFTSMAGPHRHECTTWGTQGPSGPGSKSHIKSHADDRTMRHDTVQYSTFKESVRGYITVTYPISNMRVRKPWWALRVWKSVACRIKSTMRRVDWSVAL